MTAARYRFAACELRPHARELLRDGRAVTVQRRVFDLLAYFVRNPGRVIGKEELLHNVWGRSILSDSVVASAVMKVRRAIGDSNQAPLLLQTAHRVGYRFIAKVTAEGIGIGELLAPDDARARDIIKTVELRVAVLPFRNSNQLTMCRWLELGFMSLVALALERCSIPVAQAMDVINTIRAASWNHANASDRASLSRTLAAPQLLAMDVAAVDSGYVVRWTFHDRQGAASTGVLRGSKLTMLAIDLAAAISEILLPEDAEHARHGTLDRGALRARIARALG